MGVFATTGGSTGREEINRRAGAQEAESHHILSSRQRNKESVFYAYCHHDSQKQYNQSKIRDGLYTLHHPIVL